MAATGAKRGPHQSAAPTLKCSICQVEVTAETYAQHIQSNHASPTTTHTMAAQMPPWNGQPSGGGSGNLMPLAGPILGKDLAGGKYLKGEDVPDGTVEVRFRVAQFVRDPQGRSKLAAVISETYGKTMFGFNTTNIRALVSLGFNDLQAVIGKTIILMLGMAPNPQTGKPTKALFVTRVE